MRAWCAWGRRCRLSLECRTCDELQRSGERRPRRSELRTWLIDPPSPSPSQLGPREGREGGREGGGEGEGKWGGRREGGGREGGRERERGGREWDEETELHFWDSDTKLKPTF